jgi:DNA-binding NarL/FixJ family response regulator
MSKDMALDGKTLYIVDDSPLIVERVETLLEESASIREIKSATSYSAALDLLTRQVPDIALLDIHLSNRSGIDLLRHIRKEYPAVIVIMLSNQSSIHYRSICQALGASYFIDKSTEFDHLTDILASLP